MAQDFQELQPTFAATATAAPATGAPAVRARPTAGSDPAAAGQAKSGGSWFYWVAGLSLINSIVAFTGSDWRFIIGLGITQVLDALGGEISSGGKVVALSLNVIVAGVFVLFGVLASKGHSWAFIVGMVLFGLDGMIFVLVQDWIGVAFHVFVLYCLFRGLQASRRLAV